MGWVRPTGELHGEGAPGAVQALMPFLGDVVPTERARVEGHEQFALQRTRRGAKPQWLPIKRRDDEARPGSDIVSERRESVVSGRTLAQLLG